MRNVAGKGPTLIVVADEKNRFGGFMPAGLEIKKGFFGNGEAFVFMIRNEIPVVFRATLNNQLFCFADEHGFGLGSE